MPPLFFYFRAHFPLDIPFRVYYNKPREKGVVAFILLTVASVVYGGIRMRELKRLVSFLAKDKEQGSSLLFVFLFSLRHDFTNRHHVHRVQRADPVHHGRFRQLQALTDSHGRLPLQARCLPFDQLVFSPHIAWFVARHLQRYYE